MCVKCFANGELSQERKRLSSAVQISHPAVTLGLLAGSIVLSAVLLPEARRTFGRLFIMSIGKKTLNSAKELKSIYGLTAIAMLLALRVVLGIFANSTLAIFGNTVKISGAFIPISVAGAMFGPIPAGLVGALGDIISFMLNPTSGGYFPGFTISGLLTGIIYGYALYKNDVTLPRVITGWVVNMLLVETFLNAYWLLVLNNYSAPYTFYLSARFISVGIKCIPEILLILAVGKIGERINKSIKVGSR